MLFAGIFGASVKTGLNIAQARLQAGHISLEIPAAIQEIRVNIQDTISQAHPVGTVNHAIFIFHIDDVALGARPFNFEIVVTVTTATTAFITG